MTLKKTPIPLLSLTIFKKTNLKLQKNRPTKSDFFYDTHTRRILKIGTNLALEVKRALYAIKI